MKNRTINFTKYIAYAFLSTLVLFVITGLLALSPVGVKVLVSFANDQQGLVIENPSGSFYSAVTVDHLRYSNENVSISADALMLDISLKCLVTGKACINTVESSGVDVVLYEATTASQPSRSIAEYVELPIAVFLQKLSVNKVNVFTQQENTQKVLLVDVVELSTSVSMHKNIVLHDLDVNMLTVLLPPESHTDTTQVTPLMSDNIEQWIKQLNDAQYTAIELPTIFVPVNVELQKAALKLFCLHQGKPLCTERTGLSGSINKQKLKLNVATHPQEQLTSVIELAGAVDFSNDFSHTLNFAMTPNAVLQENGAQALLMSLMGTIHNTRLEVVSAHAKAPLVTINSEFGFSQSLLPINISLAADNYKAAFNSWLPDITMPVLSVNASIKGDTATYHFNGEANIDSEQASNIAFEGQVSLEDKYLIVDELLTGGDIGHLTASLQARLIDIAGVKGISLLSDVDLGNFQLKPLMPQIDSQLNGDISIQATVTPLQLWGDVRCNDIAGLLQGIELSLLCNVSVDRTGAVLVNSLSLTQGDNTITGKGQFSLPNGLNVNALTAGNELDTQWVDDTNSAFALNVDISDLTQLYSDAAGSVVGGITVSGQINKPTILANMNVNKAKFGQLNILQAQIDAELNIGNDWQSNIDISATNIAQDNILAQDLNISVDGDLSAHTLHVNIQHPDYSLRHEISGEAIIDGSKWQWLGKWNKGMFASVFDSFVLEAPTRIDITNTDALIEPHCWLSTHLSSSVSPASKNASGVTPASSKALCIEKAAYSEQLSELNANFTYDLKVPLLHYFPDIVRPGTSLPLVTNLAFALSPEAGTHIDANSLITQANLVTTAHNIELVAVVANATLDDHIIKTNVFAGTKSTGTLGLRSTLNLDPENRMHSGQLTVDNLLLSPLQRFIPTVEKLVGLVQGSIVFDGPLVEPEVTGTLNVSDVELVLDNYPYPISNFNQTLTIKNRKAEIEGEFELGAGDASYQGTLALFTDEKPFSFVGEIQGSGMQLAFADNDLIASPSLQIALDPNNFSLKGSVSIPNADIQIDELPESAKSPSTDVIVIGKSPEPPSLPIGLDIDVRILLDPPALKRVKIQALDLKASLGGDINVQIAQKQDPTTKEFSPIETYVYGTVNILTGSYEAYGQNLQIRKGAIFFSGAPSLPQFDFEAIRNPLNTNDNVIAGIRVSGNPVVPKVELFSQPTMIQVRQLTYLLNGTDINGGESEARDVLLINTLVNFGVGNSENGVNRFGKSLGFDSLNLQASGQGSNTQVQLTGRIAENIQVSYGVGLFDQASEVILRYQLLPKMYLEATGGATSAVDLFYEWTRGE